jgi:hypothetical protein
MVTLLTDIRKSPLKVRTIAREFGKGKSRVWIYHRESREEGVQREWKIENT